MEKTKAQQLVEIANWVKSQNPSFTQHFKSMRSIIKFYLELPDGYDRKKSVVAYINKGLKSQSYSEKRQSVRLALIINTLFGVRYFTDAPYKYILRFGLSRLSNDYTEVKMVATDRCSGFHFEFKEQQFGAHCIRIKSLGDARRAADELLAGWIERSGNDYETEYGSKLLEAMKQSNPTDEKLTEGIEVRI